MPVFQDPDRRLQRPPQAIVPVLSPPMQHRISEESIRTEFCEGPVLDDSAASEFIPKGTLTLDSTAVPPTSHSPLRAREELIERIKRSQNHTWPVETLQQTQEGPDRDQVLRWIPEPSYADRNVTMHPAIQLRAPMSPEQFARSDEDAHNPNANVGAEIQRPRSALHAGDFTQPSSLQVGTPTPSSTSGNLGSGRSAQHAQHAQQLSLEATSIDIRRQRRPSLQSQVLPSYPRVSVDSTRGPLRSRAPSFHSYSRLVYKPPTSPLVHQESNDDLDDPSSTFSKKETRRRTLPPDALQSLRSLPSSLAQAARQPGSGNMDISFSSPHREARRSANFNGSFLPSFSPPTPGFLRSRRPSLSGEVSPLFPSSMVGSYEESILRGRMSTTPSKPVEFTAKIGALGQANCKPQFPDHVTLAFPAVFYNWNSLENADLPANTKPSPYVGLIDLEAGLPPPRRKEKVPKQDSAISGKEIDGSHQETVRQKSRTPKRSTSSSRRPPGGSYRIPQRGQLQIVIKNPNNTAVKLFLIPYDLEDMQPGTKTFIRQNSYLASKPTDSSSSIGVPARAVADAKPSPRAESSTLRYSVHLHICCPARGRYYLYKSIKVVFANRVPDNKEKLRYEYRLPEPRFSPYRTSSETPSSLSRSANALQHELETDVTHSGFSSLKIEDLLTRVPISMIESHRPTWTDRSSPSPNPPTSASPTSGAPPTDVPPFRPVEVSPDGFRNGWLLSPLSEPPTHRSPEASSSRPGSSSNNSSSTEGTYSKLNKGDVGYGGLFARPGTPEVGSSLLSRRLRARDNSHTPSATTTHEP